MKKINFNFFILIVILIFLNISCDYGIAPRNEPPRTGFSGTVIFKNDWPNDVYQTRIVGFKDTIKSVSDFTISNIGFISDTIPYGVSEYYFESDKNPLIDVQAGTILKYVVVAQSIVSNPLPVRNHWRVAGVYYLPDDSTKYGSVEIREGIFLTGINITVDFNNPPNQPPR